MSEKKASLPRWQRELRGAYRSLDALKTALPAMKITDEMRAAEALFPMCVTPHYASLIREPSFSDPVFAQCVPSGGELRRPSWLSDDPLGECPYSPMPHLVHRYGDRAVLLVSSCCAVYCRHCTRKRVSGASDRFITKAELDRATAYLRAHASIRDLLVSGGDPLLMADDRLVGLLATLRRDAPTLRTIRLCTRTPVTLPSRITASLVRRLRAFGPLYVSTHFNHPNELCGASLRACERFVDAGIPVQNQTVLLRGVNDDVGTLETLFRELYEHRVRPYYLFQCDLVRGIEHLRTPLATGLAIMKELRVRLSGPAIPNFCLPGEGGKIELSPDYIVHRTATATLLRNGRGEEFLYPEPEG